MLSLIPYFLFLLIILAGVWEITGLLDWEDEDE